MFRVPAPATSTHKVTRVPTPSMSAADRGASRSRHTRARRGWNGGGLDRVPRDRTSAEPCGPAGSAEPKPASRVCPADAFSTLPIKECTRVRAGSIRGDA
jgi:hypothetical protein